MHVLLFLFPFLSTALAAPEGNLLGWDRQARQEVAHPLSLGLAMTAAGLAPGDTSVVYGRTIWRANDSGLVQPRMTIGWQELTGPKVIPNTPAPTSGNRRFCTPLAGHDPVPGGRTLRLYRTPTREEDRLDPVAAQATMVLGTSAEGEFLMASLRPGEQIQITEAIPLRGGERQEHLRIKRRGKSLSITRTGSGSRVCYDDAG